jgi:hypothetical protein
MDTDTLAEVITDLMDAFWSNDLAGTPSGRDVRSDPCSSRNASACR